MRRLVLGRWASLNCSTCRFQRTGFSHLHPAELPETHTCSPSPAYSHPHDYIQVRTLTQVLRLWMTRVLLHQYPTVGVKTPGVLPPFTCTVNVWHVPHLHLRVGFCFCIPGLLPVCSRLPCSTVDSIHHNQLVSFSCLVFKLKIRCEAFQSPSDEEASHRGQAHPPTEFIQSTTSKTLSFYFEYTCWNLFEFLSWSTVLMKWELFPRHWNPGKVGLGALWTDFVLPTLTCTVGFVRQEEWLELFCFV